MTFSDATQDQSSDPLAAHHARLKAEASAIEKVQGCLTALTELLGRHPNLRGFVREKLFSLAGATPVSAEVTVNTVAPPPVPPAAVPVAPSTPSDPDAGVTAYELAVRFFKQRNNEPATVEELRVAINRPESTIRNLIYIRNKDEFEKVEGMRGRLSRWRLKSLNGWHGAQRSSLPLFDEDIETQGSDATPARQPSPENTDTRHGAG